MAECKVFKLLPSKLNYDRIFVNYLTVNLYTSSSSSCRRCHFVINYNAVLYITGRHLLNIYEVSDWTFEF